MNYFDYTSWQIDGKTMETVRDFILGGSKRSASRLGRTAESLASPRDDEAPILWPPDAKS